MIKFDQKQIGIVIIVAIIILGTIGYYFYTKLQNDRVEIISINDENTLENEYKVNNKEETIIVVHIAGQVKNPGIIKIEEGARIADVIEQAGGLNEQADITDINLAYQVEDGQKITIPKIGEEEQKNISEESQINIEETSNKKINLNKATLEELQTLQGIRRIYGTKNNRL